MTAILNDTLRHFLQSYKEANELATLPVPTVKHNFSKALAELNGPRPGEAKATEEASNAEAIAATARAEAQQAAAALERANATALTATAIAAQATARRVALAVGTTATSTDVVPSNAKTPQRLEGARAPTANPYTASVTPASTAMTNEAIQNMSIYDTRGQDEIMGGTNNDENLAIIGGRQLIRHMLYGLIVKDLHEPMEEFRQLYEQGKVDKRVKKAASPAQLNDKAARIAAAVGK